MELKDSKNCIICNNVFTKKDGVSIKQWNNSKCCSRKCFNSTKIGIKHTKEHNDKIGISNTGKVKSDECKRKISIKNTGKKRTKLCLDRLSKSHIGKTAWNKGISYIKICGNKHWNWKGGISKLDKILRRLPEYLQWRSDVFTRDNWTCRTCMKTGIYVTAHHIKGFSKIIKDNNINGRDDAKKCKELWDINNGITLCEECHKLTDNYAGRSNKC